MNSEHLSKNGHSLTGASGVLTDCRCAEPTNDRRYRCDRCVDIHALIGTMISQDVMTLRQSECTYAHDSQGKVDGGVVTPLVVDVAPCSAYCAHGAPPSGSDGA